MENWYALKGYEGEYEISDLFNVKSLDRIVERPGIRGSMKVKGKNLKQFFDNHGYLRVSIKGKFYSLHRLIAINFIPKIEGKDIINHKDSNKTNNCLENLEWCNSYENNNHTTKKKKTISGLTGVTFHKPSNKWKAQIHFNKKNKSLGYYDNKEDAFKARCNFELQNNISNCYLF
jgi:hypothetical protein